MLVFRKISERPAEHQQPRTAACIISASSLHPGPLWFQSILWQCFKSWDHSRLFCHSWSWKILVVTMKMISPLVSYELIQHCLMGADYLFLLSHTHHRGRGFWSSVLQPLRSLCSTDHGMYKVRSFWKPSPTEKVGIWYRAAPDRQQPAVWQHSELIWYKPAQCE